MKDVAQGSFPSFSDEPYSERWELLKPFLEQLYIVEKRKVHEVVDLMKSRHQFYASESQYKNRFRRWNLKKNIPTTMKTRIRNIVQTRARIGKPSIVKYNGQHVDTKKLWRHPKTGERRDTITGGVVIDERGGKETLSGYALQCGNRFFMSWNMPNIIFRLPKARAFDQSSPSDQAAMLGIEITVDTPSSANLWSSPNNIIMTNWMHQFWLFSFKTAKHYGHGPRRWTPSMLGFDEHLVMPAGSPHTATYPLSDMRSPVHSAEQHNSASERDALRPVRPSPLCRWSIHICEEPYERIPSPPPLEADSNDPCNEDTWTVWPDPARIQDFAEILQTNLESNDFSTIKVKDLPICATQMARTVKGLPNELLVEAFGFSIMGRNFKLIMDLFEETCCNVFDAIVHGMTIGEASIRKLNTNHLNHTVLDNLMIAILKAHTYCSPGEVDHAFRHEERFAGDDVDICGRWDADSTCVRVLLANGNPTIPFDWKHMFCHTSIQVICHCIGTLFGPHWAPDINTPSGLFLKDCSIEMCNRRLRLMPLHTLVMTTFCLATKGSEGETLFGMLACLLCLLGNGANPLLKADISVMDLLGIEEDVHECSHTYLDPLEFAGEIPEEVISRWPKKIKIGWRVFCHVLGLSQAEWRFRPAWESASSVADEEFFNEYGGAPHYRDDVLSIEETQDGDMAPEAPVPIQCQMHKWHRNFFGRNRTLSTIWAAVQTEFLTYRKLAELDSWISENFDMESLLSGLDSGNGAVEIWLADNEMMKSYCDCGVFEDVQDEVCIRAQEASIFYFSNFEDWNRSTFIASPGHRTKSWHNIY
ncbi:hypothetical protein BGZ57DRAFT_968841 [Hyaloscypha finlandica]|nr:hypothetical protein BGZ57DRAFT_968841 [Hyaloscypha finlandica]